MSSPGLDASAAATRIRPLSALCIYLATALSALCAPGCKLDAAALLKRGSGPAVTMPTTSSVAGTKPSSAPALAKAADNHRNTIETPGRGGLRPLSPESDFPPKPKDWVKARPGIDAIKPMAPTWCPSKEARKDPSYPAPDGEFFDRAWAPDDAASSLIGETNANHLDLTKVFYSVPERAVHLLAWSSCMRPDNPNMQAWVAIGRQIVSNAYGFSEADNRAFLAWALKTKRDPLALGPKTASDDEEACKAYSSAPAGDDPEKVALAQTEAWAAGCSDLKKFKTQMLEEVAWKSLRRRPEVSSEVLKAALVGRCLHSLDVGRNQPFPWDNAGAVGELVYCSHDAHSLSRDNLRKELAALKLPERLHWNAFTSLSYVATVAEQTLREEDDLIKRIPALKDVLLDAPESAQKEWAASYKANKAALDLAADLELNFARAQGSRSGVAKAFAGCNEALAGHFTKHLRSKKVKSVDDFIAAATDSVGSQIVASLVACNAALGNRATASSLYRILLAKSRAGTGPREAACIEATKRLTLVAADRSDLPFKENGFCTSGIVQTTPWVLALMKTFNLSTSSNGTEIVFTAHTKGELDKAFTPDGAVASVKKNGTSALVTFKAEKYQSPVYDCRYTNKIAYWEFLDGKAFPRHEQICTLKGYETRVTQIPNLIVPAYEAAALAPGSQVRAITAYDPESKNPDPLPGTILEIYRDKGRTKLAALFGFELP